MTLEEMAQRQQSQTSSENSTSDKQTDLLTKLNSENKSLTEKINTLSAKNTELMTMNSTLTKKNTSLMKTIDQKEDTIRAMNAKLLFPPKPKIEYKVRERFYQKCTECNIKQVKSELEETELTAEILFIFTALFMLFAAIKNYFIRRDICSLAVSFSNLVCLCGGKIGILLSKAAHTADEISNATAAKFVGCLIYILFALILIMLIIGVLWLLSYILVYLFKTYWKGIYSGLSAISAAVVILLFDTPILEECVNTILLHLFFTIVLIIICEILRFKGVIDYE